MTRAVAVDAAFLAVLLDPRARPLVEGGAESIARLVVDLSASGVTVIVPTPALAQVLTHAAEAGQAYMSILKRCACFQIRPFDDKAAIELAELSGRHPGFRDMLNFDRQIVAIARVYGAAVLYANQEKVAAFAAECGLTARRFKDLASIERGAIPSEP